MKINHDEALALAEFLRELTDITQETSVVIQNGWVVVSDSLSGNLVWDDAEQTYRLED